MRVACLLPLFALAACAASFQSADGLKIRSAGAARFSPDGNRIAYTVTRNDLPGRPMGQLFVLNLATGQTAGFSAGDETSGDPVWSPDGKWIAYADHNGLTIAHPDATAKKHIGPLEGTNSPLPTTGARVAWSPDSTHIAWV